MKKGNMLDIAIKAVRDSGKTNMWQSNSVQYYAFQMGFFEFVNWYEEANRGDYTTLMISSEYDKIKTVNAKKLLELENPSAAREVLMKQLEEEMKSFTDFSLKQIPFSTKEIDCKKDGIYHFVNSLGEDHYLNYAFHSPVSSNDIFYLKDGIFEYQKGVFVKVTDEEWEKITKVKESLSRENKEKYEALHKKFRLRALYEKSS